MKILFQKGANGLELTYVECNTTEEADHFQSWFASKVNPNEDQIDLPLEPSQETTEVPVENVTVTRAELSKLAIALVQTKGRQAIDPILKRYKAKRISEIPEDKIGDAYADVAEAM